MSFKNVIKNSIKGNSRVKLWIVMTVLLLTAAVLPAGCGIQGKDPGTEQTASQSGVTAASATDQENGSAAENSPEGKTAVTENTKSDNARKEKAGKDNAHLEKAGKDDSEKAAAGPGEAVPSLREPLHVGDVLQDGSLRILYMASGEYEEESEFRKPEAGCKYIFVRFAFQNTDPDSDCSISLLSFQCFADGFSVPAYFGGEKEPAPSLSRDRTSIGNLYFTVPEEAKEIEIEYRPDHLAKDKVRFLYEGEKDAGIEIPPDTARTAGACKVGDSVSSDRQRIKYLSCEKDDSDNEFIRPAEGCSFWTLTFEFENLEKEERQVSIHDFSCYADGISCSRNLFRDDYISETIPCGRKARGTVTFEVPDQAATVEVEYASGNRGEPHVVFTAR